MVLVRCFILGDRNLSNNLQAPKEMMNLSRDCDPSQDSTSSNVFFIGFDSFPLIILDSLVVSLCLTHRASLCSRIFGMVQNL